MNGPAILSGPSAQESLDLHRRERASGRPPFSDANSNVYAAKSVRKIVYDDQGQKCCYCEKQIEKSYNDIEHYRPKKSVRESPSHKGYWWLSYEWNNLLYACPQCNRTGKNDKFPITDENNRCFEPTADIALENPYILNPYTDNVETLFSYEFSDNEVKILPSSLDTQRKAKRTIEVLKLNRKDLKEFRFGTFSNFEFILNDLSEQVENADEHQKSMINEYLKSILGPKTPYVGMLRYYFKIISNKANS